jgi:DNA polymerase-3 subunit beta
MRLDGDTEAPMTIAAAADVGETEGQVEANLEGDAVTIAFNARYLNDVLGNVQADRFALELNGPLSPGVFRPVGDDAYVHVVMPVRTTS